ncbi:hypothetical protein [Streptomyces justiciae]|uniref:hypothetical protein n=1 Tax=Streptomyces justiciae TaxID=2780140 RepID=UPI001880DF85|nr:hypothetical protein [Streptomyces justiciae]MBE8478371.1 hypothetical protein [Streptomyces justiciae]
MPSAPSPAPDPQDDRSASDVRSQDLPAPAGESPDPQDIADIREVSADEDAEYEPL